MEKPIGHGKFLLKKPVFIIGIAFRKTGGTISLISVFQNLAQFFSPGLIHQ